MTISGHFFPCNRHGSGCEKLDLGVLFLLHKKREILSRESTDLKVKYRDREPGGRELEGWGVDSQFI